MSDSSREDLKRSEIQRPAGARGGGGKGGGGRGGSGAGMGGGGSGGGGRMGASGNCICPKCERRTPHRPGAPCIEERCPECGVALVREGSPHHREILTRRGDAGDR
jgi:hypothetical protein